ncbi:hypothetical protein MPER_03650, partial [Moniliophthora perniciosa FA553]
MPRFEFEGAVTLAAFSLASGLAFILNRPKEGKIKLPAHTEDVATNGSEAEIPDPFDVARPEDWVEGYPLEEEKFWKYARGRKAVLCLLATAILILQAVRLGLTIEDGQTGQKVLATNALYLYYSVFLLVVSVRSLKHTTVESHTESILHITALTTLPSLLLGTCTILPNTSPFSELDLRISFITDRL